MIYRPRERQGGFTLIELLIVVVIIGIIAAILIPNLLDALHKAKQKRTVSDMRNTGIAWMSWLTDQVGAASAGAQKTWVGDNTIATSYEELFGYMHQNDSFYYMQDIPQLDGWQHPYLFGLNSNLLATNVLVICSGGRDGSNGTSPNCAGMTHNVEPFLTTDYDQDIIWADGYFVRWPGTLLKN